MTRTPYSALTLVLLLCMSLAVSAARANGEKYVCPPCGDAHDRKTYDAPGICPVCGMKLVPKPQLEERTNVAILVFDGVQIIDFTGPYEVFGQGGVFDVFTVSETGAEITTAMDLSVRPAYKFEDCPKPDILIVPGGNVDGPQGSVRTIEWVRDVSQDATYVMSVCNGAFILAKAGLLDGRSATTFYRLIDDLRKAAPQTTVVSDQRWVDNGKIITTAGLSSGIEGSLHLISKIRGMARAQAVALHLEYHWDPESNFARAALADMRFPDLDPPEGAELELLFTDGNRESWTRRYAVTSALSSSALAADLASQLDRDSRWQPARAGAEARDPQHSWISVDTDGAAWTFSLAVDGSGSEGEPAIVTLHIDKGGAPEPRRVNNNGRD